MIRKLELKDSKLMLGCMRDENVNRFMKIDGNKMTSGDCENFIRNTMTFHNSKHFAIVNEKDEWVGTISLKNIDDDSKSAEYAIITSSQVHGNGYAFQSTLEILEYGFEILGLNRIYLNVVKDNIKANKFYQKVGFQFEGCFRRSIKIKEKIYDLNWYSILRFEYDKIRKKNN